MIRALPRTGGIAIQAEDEIAAISMCIGAAMTGRRVLTATSGPGISLCSENIGLAIMGEVPLVIVDVQRMGPATGGATTPAQGDVQFVRWGTSGGYPIIVLVPGSVADCYSLTLRAFDYAERFRSPVFLLTDKELFQSLSTVEVGSYEPRAVGARREAHPLPAGTPGLRPEESFLPYCWEPLNAAPPFSRIGGPLLTRFTGSSHDEHGFLTKDPEKVGRLNEHLRCKIEDHAAEIELAKADLERGARTLFIAYGITARAMTEAAGIARAGNRPVSTLEPQTLWPVPENAILNALAGPDHPPHPTDTPADTAIRRVVVAELNLGDFRREVERVIYRWAAQRGLPAPEVLGIHRVDSELITPGQFLEAFL